MGDIGRKQREVEFEPIEAPAHAPAHTEPAAPSTPAPAAPVTEPAREEPVPA